MGTPTKVLTASPKSLKPGTPPNPEASQPRGVWLKARMKRQTRYPEASELELSWVLSLRCPDVGVLGFQGG